MSLMLITSPETVKCRQCSEIIFCPNLIFQLRTNRDCIQLLRLTGVKVLTFDQYLRQYLLDLLYRGVTPRSNCIVLFLQTEEENTFIVDFANNSNEMDYIDLAKTVITKIENAYECINKNDAVE